MGVTRDTTVLGQGALLPGHFAAIEEGYEIGFAGLEKWSEIVISRRNYGGLVVAGGLVALIGSLVLPLTVWKGW